MEYYISNVTATGPNKETSTIDFTPGLNVVCGPSDTGKSIILKSIKYCFGSSTKPFSADVLGYTAVSVTIKTLSGQLVLKRNVRKKSGTIEVDSTIPNFKSGTYDAEYSTKKANEHPVIASLLLQLIGINTEPMIIKNQQGTRNHMTFNSILRAFYLSEEEIDSFKPILPPHESTTVPFFLSCLLYLLSGNDFSGKDEIDSDAVSKAKKKALEEFSNSRISNLSKRRDELQKFLDAFADVNVEQSLQTSIAELSEAESAIEKCRQRQKEIIEARSICDAHISEYSLTLQRYDTLKTQLEADLDRIAFSNECAELESQVPRTHHCPYCNGQLEDIQVLSIIESSKGEISRIAGQLNGLEASCNDISANIKEEKEIDADLEKEWYSLKQQIMDKLEPKAKQLTTEIKEYRRYIEVKNEFDVLHRVSENIQTALAEELEKKPVDNSKFKPKDHYPVDFQVIMSKYAYEILSESRYRNLNTADFQLGIFDLVINGEKKSETHGKGYYSFINTVAGLTLRQYFIHNATYKPGIFMVDTPLHGFDEGTTEQDQRSMQNGIFEYFINHASEGQIIVMENEKNMPNIDFDALGVNIVEYTKDIFKSKHKNSRHGFLISVSQ